MKNHLITIISILLIAMLCVGCAAKSEPAAEPADVFSSAEEAVEHIKAVKASEAENERSQLYEKDYIYFLNESPLSEFTESSFMLVSQGTAIIYSAEDYKEQAVFSWTQGDETDEKVKERISRFNLKRYSNTKFFFGELQGDVYVFWWENGDAFNFRYPADFNVEPKNVIEHLEVEKYDV